ncbi:MAG: hypothetical protein Q9160_006991 [Pyrenula sp. 1 TL-2023]
MAERSNEKVVGEAILVPDNDGENPALLVVAAPPPPPLPPPPPCEVGVNGDAKGGFDGLEKFWRPGYSRLDDVKTEEKVVAEGDVTEFCGPGLLAAPARRGFKPRLEF